MQAYIVHKSNIHTHMDSRNPGMPRQTGLHDMAFVTHFALLQAIMR
jgi:hypothetical protein